MALMDRTSSDPARLTPPRKIALDTRRQLMTNACMSDFITMLKDARADIGQAEFARQIGVSQSFLSHIELGRRLPSKSFVNLLCGALGVKQTDNLHKLWHRAAARARGWEV